MKKRRPPFGLKIRLDTGVDVGFQCGSLTVIGVPFMVVANKSGSEPYAVCECSCGKIGILRVHALKYKTIGSCGCINNGPVTHGESRTRLHGIWCCMKTRCSNPNDAAWEYYGGRGISVCQEWVESYEAFRDWALANGYSSELELDRRDVNGNYEPGNCRWATRCQQMQNTRKRRDAKTSKFRGVSKHSQNGNWIAQICGREGIKSSYIGSYDTEEEAAHAYDRAAIQTFGEFASLNFPRKEGVLR